MTGPSLLVAPSLLAVDFDVEAARRIDPVADWLHIDIMDNVFVPNRTIGLPEMRRLRAETSVPFDCHLMIADPEEWAVRYVDSGASTVTFHVEAAQDPVALAKDVRSAGGRVGLAIDRDTPVDPYLELLPHFDLLLIMTIKAGFGGQAFLPEMLDKVRRSRRHIRAGHLELRVEVDGGIAEDTIGQAAQAGADTFVAGTAVFTAADPDEAVRRLRRLAGEAIADLGPGGLDPSAGGGGSPR